MLPYSIHSLVVRAEGLEPPRLSPLVPKTSASTNSATPALHKLNNVRLLINSTVVNSLPVPAYRNIYFPRHPKPEKNGDGASDRD